MMPRTGANGASDGESPLRSLHDEHVAMAAALRELAEHAHRGDAPAMRSAFVHLEKALRDHLALEDDKLLPRFGEVNPSEAVALRGEHARIRRRLDDLGIALELHTLRAEMIDDFIDLLYRHAVREERALYAWSEQALPIAERHSLFSSLLGRLDERLARAATR
jgi:hemerythrin-like domain-containing protein